MRISRVGGIIAAANERSVYSEEKFAQMKASFSL